MKYFKGPHCTFAYDPKVKFLTKIDNTNHLVQLIQMISPSLSGEKALTQDFSQEILFVNTDELEITAFGALG